MRKWHLFLLPLLLLAVAPDVTASPEGAAPATGAAELGYKAYRRWKLELPHETFRTVGTQILLAGAPHPFRTKVDGEALSVDTDGDGSFDVKVEGKDGFVTLASAGDEPYRYALRLKKGASGWTYAAGSARTGTIDGVEVRFIDQDGNGSFSDVGTDAMIVGTQKAAAYLSRVLNVAGRLYTVEVAADGTSLRYAPYTGPRGRLDLTSGLESKARVLTVLVKGADGTTCFDLARVEGAMEVPAGRYELLGGRLGLGAARVGFVRGRAEPLVVEPAGTTTLAWGGPLRPEYRYALTATEIGFSPDQVWYYGKAGEQYVTWSPFGKSPEFSLVSRKTKDEIASAIFTGC